MTTLNEFLAEQLKDPEFRKEYERAKIEIEEEMRKAAENELHKRTVQKSI